MAEIKTKDALLNAADVCAKSTSDQLDALIEKAAFSSRMVMRANMEDVYQVGMTSTLDRLRRNANALTTLLRMAKDAQECIATEIHAIFEAYDAAERERIHLQKQALALELERQKNKKRNERAKEIKAERANSQ